MNEGARDRWLVVFLAAWATLAVASIWLRPLWPVDETRYASVAWEMWLRGDFLVPYLNGEPYSHKPPLLFWLIHLGWAVFGVNDWWPRLVAPLCALGSVPLLLKMEKLLGDRSGLSPWILFGTLLFAAMVTLTMMDLLLMLCAMAGMIGVLNLNNQKRIPGLLWLGAGIGLGALAKGPVILLHVLPAALIAPWWAPGLKGRLARWYLDLMLGVLLGAAIALAWAVPAAWAGGDAYREAIFWGQTVGRVSESFAHRAPWWYYLPLLPLVLFPWFVVPRFWIGLKNIRQEKSTRFLAAWLVLTLVAFSLVSGKQARYLVPCLPGFALLAGIALSKGRAPWWDLLPPALGLLAGAALLACLRAWPEALGLPVWASEIPFWPVAALALGAASLLVVTRGNAAVQLRSLAFATLFGMTVVGAGVVPALVPYADPGPVARHLAGLQARQVPLAHLGKYHAQYNFAGRLAAPIEILDPPELASWVAAHPEGRVMTVERSRAPEGAAGPATAEGGPATAKGGPEYQAPFRGAWLQLWRGESLLVARAPLR
jgi:4-amino-4-deoxy-L-arabinose transferase-like glycosyltransferase